MPRSPQQLALLRMLFRRQMESNDALAEMANRYAALDQVEPPAPPPKAAAPAPSEPEYEEEPVSEEPVSRQRIKLPQGTAFVEGMVKRGWTPEEAAGAAGNVYAESSFRPDVESKDGSAGYLQWRSDRLKGLQNMAAATGRDWRDPEVQMDWIHMERSGDSVKYGGSNEKGAYGRALSGGGTPQEIAKRFGQYVERPADLSASLSKRQQVATQLTPTTGAGESKTVTPTTGGPLPVYPAQGFVFHHSGGSSLESLRATLKQRGLGSQYLMDRDGTIYSFAGAGSPHIKPNDKYGGRAPGLSNANAVGMEIVAKDDGDLTPAQIASARKFIAENYPDVPVYGHGEVNPGHKQATEGMTVTNAIRADRATRPAGQTYVNEDNQSLERVWG